MCRGCDKTWSGKAMAHCPTCHETFSTVNNFDLHRKEGSREKQLSTPGGMKNRRCRFPEDCGLKQNSRGTWMLADERDVSALGILRGYVQREP